MPHIMEMMGKARVVVKDGKVVEVGAPEVEWCPLFVKLRGVEKMTPDEIRKNMEVRISELGMFTDKRKLEFETTVVAFGASEIMMSGLNSGFLETTVTACDGAGTVISGNPALVQGIGGRMSGLVETEPVNAVIKGIEGRGGVVLDPSTALINPAGGVKRAAELGYKKIAVTVADAETVKRVREIESE